MNNITRLTTIAASLHVADQIALVSVPLTAALVFNASPETLGLLVACQSLAHLLGSLPFGIMVDRFSLRNLTVLAALISAIGFAGATAGLFTNSVLGFGSAITIAGFGVVLFSLTALSIIPKIADKNDLSKNNATIELPRTLATFGVPLAIAAVLTAENTSLVFAFATIASAIAIIVSAKLPKFESSQTKSRNVISELLEGGRFVLQNGYLRAIALCAVFWNLAFTALLVVMVPLLASHYNASPNTFGLALAAFGLGAVAGTWFARQYSQKIAPKLLLLFGPTVSVLAAIALLFGPQTGSTLVVLAAFVVLGFGPSIWLITQNTIRQTVTPSNMLGRVNAVIQTTIYGMRPLGALIGGFVTGAASAEIGLLVVAVLFSLSAVATLFGGLRKIESFGALQTSA